MDYSIFLQNHFPQFEQLKNYGFIKKQDCWLYDQQLSTNHLLARFVLQKNKLEIEVIDRNINDIYLPFYRNDSNAPIKAEVEILLQDIMDKCFTTSREIIIEYCHQKYQTVAEAPWQQFPDYLTFKTKKRQKWYAIIMRIKAKNIGLPGEQILDVINVKLPTTLITDLINNHHYFSAYHMNKKNWLTILLNNNTDLIKLQELIDISYRQVEKI